MRLAAILVSTLIVVVLGALVAGSVLTSGGAARTTSSPTTATTPPGAPTTRSSAPITAATLATCTIEAGELRTAEDAYQAVNGVYSDSSGLVARGLLRALPTLHTITTTDGFASYTVVGQRGCP